MGMAICRIAALGKPNECSGSSRHFYPAQRVQPGGLDVCSGGRPWRWKLALLLGVLVRQAIPSSPCRNHPDQYKGVALGLLIIPLAYYLMGLYPGYGTSEAGGFKDRVYATLFAFALLIGWAYIVQELLWSREFCSRPGFALVLPPVRGYVPTADQARLGTACRF